MVFIASMMSSVWPARTWLPISTIGPRAGLRPEIGGADHRRGDDARMLGRIAGRRVADAGGGCRRRDGARGAAARDHSVRLARDAHAHAVALELDLGEAGLVEQLRELADQRRGRPPALPALSSLDFGPRATAQPFRLAPAIAASPSIASA